MLYLELCPRCATSSSCYGVAFYVKFAPIIMSSIPRAIRKAPANGMLKAKREMQAVLGKRGRRQLLEAGVSKAVWQLKAIEAF
jgi:hypothetical protein